MTALPLSALRAMAEHLPPSEVEVGDVEDVALSRDGREMVVRIYRPLTPHAGRGVVVWLHGGGFVLGGLALGDDTARRLCRELGVVVVAPDYATAPEHPFPAALDDCAAVLEWIDSGPPALESADVARVVVAGDSAGGNLAMASALRCRDERRPQMRAQVSVYGTTECVVSNPELGDLPFLTSSDAEWFWSAYTDDPEHPYVAPARAASVADLPPLLMVTAEHDPTRDASERYVRDVLAAGGEAHGTRYPGVAHGFFAMVELLPEARAALEEVAAFIAPHVGGETGGPAAV